MMVYKFRVILDTEEDIFRDIAILEEDTLEERDKLDNLIETKSKNIMNRQQRTSVSAEVCGKYYSQKDFIFKTIIKSDDQKQRILAKMQNSFLFDSLEDKDIETVLNAMEEAKFRYALFYNLKQKC